MVVVACVCLHAQPARGTNCEGVCAVRPVCCVPGAAAALAIFEIIQKNQNLPIPEKNASRATLCG